MDGIKAQLEIIENMVLQYENMAELDNIITKLREKLGEMKERQKQIESLKRAQESLFQSKFDEEDFEAACYEDNVNDLREALKIFSYPFSEESKESFRDMKENPVDEDDTEEEAEKLKKLMESFEIDDVFGVIPKFVYEMNNNPGHPITMIDSNGDLLYNIKAQNNRRKIKIQCNIPDEMVKHWTYDVIETA